MHHRVLARRNHRRRRAIDVGVQPYARGVEPHLVPRWIARDDAVEIVGIALRFDQRLASAGRARAEIRAHGAPIVVRGDDRLCGDGHLVDRSIAEVHEFLGMAGDEIGVLAHVTGIGARRRHIPLSPMPPAPDRESTRLTRRCRTPAACDSTRHSAARLQRGCRSHWRESAAASRGRMPGP